MSRNAQNFSRIYRPAAWLVAGLFAWCALVSLPAVPPTHSRAPSNARVVIVEQAGVLHEFSPQPELVNKMVTRGLVTLTGKADVTVAWRSLIGPKEIIGIKVFSAPGAISGTRPAVVAAVVEGLLKAGFPATNMVVWDKSEDDLRHAGFFEFAERYHVRVAGAADAGWDEKTFYESELLGKLVWGDHEFGSKKESIGRRSFVSQLVTRGMTKIISIAPLQNHNLTGVHGHLHSLAFGSVDNSIRFESSPGRLHEAIPDIYALPALGDRVVLNITDALLCQYQGEQRGLLHYSVALNQLRFSTDPVALDVLSLEELERQRKTAGVIPVKPPLELYQNASLLEIGVSDRKKIRVEMAR